MTEMMGLSSRRWCVLLLVASSLVTTTAWAAVPKEPQTPLDQKEFFQPDLYISSSHVPLEEILDQLPNRSAWERYRAARDEPRRPQNAGPHRPALRHGLQPDRAFPLIPGRGGQPRHARGLRVDDKA